MQRRILDRVMRGLSMPSYEPVVRVAGSSIATNAAQQHK
jgi:hypothetical protein